MVAMNGRIRIALVLTVLLLVIEAITITGQAVTKATATGWKIDAFTAKNPLSGLGENESCDAFSPEENIQIYAKLTYNDFPISQRLISFQLIGPPNEKENITHVYTGLTNDSGLASTPALSETTFGEWTALVSTQVTSEILINDSLTFNFGWIVNFTSIKTINALFEEQTQFTKGTMIGVEIGLCNIALTEKNVALSISILDSLGFYVNSTEMNVIVPANETAAFYYLFMQIPMNAHLGFASLYANVYRPTNDSGGIPYCPQITRIFTLGKRNLSILQVKPSSQTVYKNETVFINVLIANTGDTPESFNVSTYRNETALDQITILNLMPSANITVSFVWHTAEDALGKYLIKAVLSTSSIEEDQSDNTLTGGFVDIIELVHDIEISGITPSAFTIYAGSFLDIGVTIKNKGTEPEKVDLTLYYDNNIINTWNTSSLASLEERTIVFRWNTANVPVGDYILNAYLVPVEGEENIADNTLTDGSITILAPSKTYAYDWTYWILSLLALLFLLILVPATLLFRKRKRKTKENDFISGWTAWYYGYRMPESSHHMERGRNHKNKRVKKPGQSNSAVKS